MATIPLQEIVLAGPRGFCAGVDRAIDIVELALQVCPPPVYVRREIVHNRHVVEALRTKGAHFVDELDEVPDDATVIFSAHGISPAVRHEAQRRGLRVIDATCPLVTKVHLEAIRYAREGYSIVLVGHADHDEVVGTMGEAPERMFLIAHPEEVDRLQDPRPGQGRLPDADDPLRRRHARLHRGAAAPLPEDRRARQGRHLLRDPEPPGLGQDGGGRSGRAARHRRRQQLERQPPGRGLDGDGHAVLPDQRQERHPARVAGRLRARRRDRRRLDAGVSRHRGRRGAPARAVAEVVREVHVVEEDVRFGLPRELEDIARRTGKTLPPRSGAAVGE